ncbi:MAG: hypothetical protein IJW64_01135 [Clostridia bacterium]|nr:hypothetical protein [Clostridia bacterium]
MNYKSLNLKNFVTDGRQRILPSAFPFYDKSEIEKLFTLSLSDRADKIAEQLKVDVDEGESLTVRLGDELFAVDFTYGGEDSAKFSNCASPFVISAIIDAISQMDLDEEKVVLGAPADKGLLLSAYIVKEMGFPIEKIVVASDLEKDCEHFSFIDVSDEDTFEYIADFYEDFDFLLGVEEAKASLALEIYTDGFRKKSLLINAFGFSHSAVDCCFALSGKNKTEKDSAKWIEENCALSFPTEKSERKFQPIDKNLMKELCNL